MKNILLFFFLTVISMGTSFGQDNPLAQAQTETQAGEAAEQKIVTVGRIDQTGIKREMAEQNERLLYRETAKIIKNEYFKNFTVLIGWYKQTKTHYYYQIGWTLDGKPGLEYMKYRWVDGDISRSTKEEVDADTDYGNPPE